MSSGYNPYAPVGAPSPYGQPQASGGQILPGTITYTTSTGPDGSVIYHPFKYVQSPHAAHDPTALEGTSPIDRY